MSNILSFKINSEPLENTNLFVLVTNDTAVADDLVVLYTGAGIPSDAQGNVNLDIGESGVDGQKVLVYTTNRPTTDADTFSIMSGSALLAALEDTGAVGIPALVRAQSVTLPAQTGVTKVLFLGASIQSYIASGRSSLITGQFAEHGLNVSIYDESVGGRHVDEILTAWEEVKATYAPFGSELLVLGHVIGNDVSGYRPYDSMTGAQKTSLRADIDALKASVEANGNIWMPLEATFRGYDNTTLGDYYTWENEDNGSLPFNTEIMNPVSELMSPAQYDDINDASFVQLYNFTYNNGVDFLETSSNRIHPKGDGIEFYRRFLVDNIAAWIKGEPNIAYEKLSWQDAIISKRVPQSFWVGATSGVPTGASTFIPFVNILDAEDTAVSQGDYMLPESGYVPNSIFLGKSSLEMVSGSSSNIANDTSVTQYNQSMIKNYMYSVNSEAEEFITMTGFYPNQEVRLTIISANGSGSYNQAAYTFNGGNEVKIISRITDPSVAEVTVSADVDGKLVISLRSSSSERKALFNAMRVEPL